MISALTGRRQSVCPQSCCEKPELPFFPIDIPRLLASFRHQIHLMPYSNSRKQTEHDRHPVSFDPLTLSQDGFCIRIQDVLMDFGAGAVSANTWEIYYNDNIQDTRIRFTLMHELGHVLLGHHQILNRDIITGLNESCEYRAADAQADQFSINILAPAPAAARLLSMHGFTFSKETGAWTLTNKKAPFLLNLGNTPHPDELLMTAFGLSKAAARRRLDELESELLIWQDLDADLFHYLESIPHRSGWYCWVCNTRRRTQSLYCPGCGKGWSYEFRYPGLPSRPVMGLRETGQFGFCSVCGNDEYSPEAEYCPVCGSPVINKCENHLYTDGDFIRSGMHVIRGTHRCRPTDIYCGTCGVLTAFGAQHGPKENMWLPGKSERCRTKPARYPHAYQAVNGKLTACPACHSNRSLRNGRYCTDCMQPLENSCVSNSGLSHPCDPNDRYCEKCGNPTLFLQSGLLQDYLLSPEYKALLQAEGDALKTALTQLFIRNDSSLMSFHQEVQG